MRYTYSLYSAVRDLVKALYGRKILVFGNSYKVVETIGWILKREGLNVAIHKGGLPRDVRMQVEKAFRLGDIKTVIATPTLELGIDIGDVDVVISELVSYSQFLQRVGRAGRKGQESIGILLLRDEDAISNYYRLKPEDYFSDDFYCYAEKANEEVMFYQILSMCIEKPLEVEEIRDEWKKVVERLEKMRLITKMGDIYMPSSNALDFFKGFNMRGIGETVKMYKGDEFIGERNLPIAIKELFPGSIIIHNGERLICKELRLDERIAILEEYPYGNEITDPLYMSIPKIVSVEEERDGCAYCNLEITMSVYAYIVRDVFSREKLGIVNLEEPVEYSFSTKGFILSAPMPDPMDYDDFYAGTFHALEHVLIEASDALTGGGSQYMGGISTPEGDIFVYDATIGGSGLSKLLFKRLNRAFEIAYEVLKNCECQRVDGCPRCTYSYQCGNNNQPLNRIGAINVLEKLLKGERGKLDVSKYEVLTEFKYYPR
jgi:DEAD/DEAH box helicase domain-containing protein